MSYSLTKAAFQVKTGRSADKLVLVCLAWLAGPDRRCAVSNAVIGHMACIDDKTASLAVSRLTAAGHISWRPRGRGKSYTVNVELLPDFPDIDAHGQVACNYCGGTGVSMELDHIHPRSRGGTDDHDNLAIACIGCNTDKGALTVEEWRA
jgi:hypothetical protein